MFPMDGVHSRQIVAMVAAVFIIIPCPLLTVVSEIFSLDALPVMNQVIFAELVINCVYQCKQRNPPKRPPNSGFIASFLPIGFHHAVSAYEILSPFQSKNLIDNHETCSKFYVVE